MILTMLTRHEGFEPGMYLDGDNNVTIGIGHLLAKSIDAATLPFYRISDSTPAGSSAIVNAWAKLKYQTAPPKTLKDKTLFMRDGDINALAMKDMFRFQPTLDETFPVFEDYPQQAQCAIWDMIWQLGSFGQWPKFVAAVKAKNWEEAARQCYRKNAGMERNQDTKDLFIAASQMNPDFV